jgi:hypothetical protein
VCFVFGFLVFGNVKQMAIVSCGLSSPYFIISFERNKIFYEQKKFFSKRDEIF